MSLPAFIAMMIFLEIFFLAFSLTNWYYLKRTRVHERLEKILGNQPPRSENKAPDKRDKWGFKVLEYLGKLVGTRGLNTKIDKELARADIPLKGEEFWGLTLLLSLGMGILTYVFTRNLFFTTAVVSYSAYLPWGAVRVKQNKRRAKFNGQIGDALVIMANALRSGFSFLQAMDMVRKEMPDPIAKEFGIALLEMNWGSSTEAALAGLSERVKSDDLDLVITAVLIQRQVGGNLAEILDNIAHTIRERVRIKGEIQALTAQGRISGLIIGLLPMVLAVVIYTLNPGYLSLLFTTKAGLMMLAGAGLAELLGVLMIRQIIRIQV